MSRFARGRERQARLPRCDLDTAVGKQRSDRVLDAIDSLVERLAILDQRPMLTHLVRGHVDRFELPHHRQASQLQGVVFVGLAFRRSSTARLLRWCCRRAFAAPAPGTGR